MTNEEYNRVRPVIDMAQRLHHKLHGQLADKGVEPIDILIASLYSTHNFACFLHRPLGDDPTAAEIAASKIAGIEWMRTALDNIERQALADSGRGKLN